jgi:hypothetical protein
MRAGATLVSRFALVDDEIGAVGPRIAIGPGVGD